MTGLPGSMHPVTPVLLWLVFLVVVAGASAGTLAILFAMVATGIGLGGAAARVFRILWRARWIMVSAFLVFAFLTPGETFFPAFPRFSPTLEGVSAGGLHTARLALALASLGWMLARLDRDALTAAVYWLAQPFSFFGLDPARLALRLALTMRFAEARGKTSLAGLQRVLGEPEFADTSPVRVAVGAPALRDGIMVAGALLCAILAM